MPLGGIFCPGFVMSRTTVFYKAKTKAHITYIAYEAIASQRSPYSLSQENLL